MKFHKLFCIVLAVSLVYLTSCAPDKVGPGKTNSSIDTPGLNAALEEIHPEHAPQCSPRDTFNLIETDGNMWVDYCGFLPCSGPQVPWGFVELYNTDTLMVMNFALATGWFVNLFEAQLALQSSFNLDPNGVPQPESNWINIDVNPLVNLWQIIAPLDTLPSPCFAIASRNRIVLLDFLGNPDPNSTTTAWMWNPNSASMTDPNRNTSSPFLVGWCPSSCGGGSTCACSGGVSELTFTLSANTPWGSTVEVYNESQRDIAPTNLIAKIEDAQAGDEITISASQINEATLNGTVTLVINGAAFEIDASCNSCMIGVSGEASASNSGSGSSGGSASGELEYCTYNLEVKVGDVINIRDYVHVKDGTAPVDWNNVTFSYADQTTPANWNLAAFNAGQDVVITAADANGGNHGDGRYRVEVGRNDQSETDDHMTIRVDDKSEVEESKCPRSGGGFEITGFIDVNGGACDQNSGNPTGCNP